jgi:DnaJ-domain-containing protein 1
VEVILISITVFFIVGYISFSKENPFQKKATKHTSTDYSAFKKEREKESGFSGVFNETFLALAAFVIKSDDDIAQSELNRVRTYFRTYYPGYEQPYLERLNSYLRKDIDINDTCKTILDAGFNDKFQMMIQLFNIASADNHIYISEYVALHDIFDLLNLPNLTFITIRGLFGVSFTHKEVLDFKEQAFKRGMNDWKQEFEERRQQKEEEKQRREREKRKQEQYQKQQQSYNNYYQYSYKNKGRKDTSSKGTSSKKSPSKLESAYIILGLEKGASLKQIKKAFRKLAHAHHPDKVAHLGEGSVKQAEVIFRKIKDAYELLINSLNSH